MKTKSQGRAKHMTVKLDMSKAYDKVEWEFMRVMMRKMGFDGLMDQFNHLLPNVSQLFCPF
jgi:hypothetical protein